MRLSERLREAHLREAREILWRKKVDEYVAWRCAEDPSLDPVQVKAEMVEGTRPEPADWLARRRRKEASRRARVRGASIGFVDRERVIRRDRSRCYLCGKVCVGGDVTLDHAIPLAKGGAHTEENLRVACRLCNAIKGASMPPSGRGIVPDRA